MTMFEAVCGFLRESGVEMIGICGTTPMGTRTASIDRFLHVDAVNVAVLTLGTCSTGLNLVPVTHMIFLELQWTPAIIHQAECRINRIGGARALTYEYVLARGTLDRYVFGMLSKKNEVVNAIVDNGANAETFDFDVKRPRIGGVGDDEVE
jgi:SWI/SNF-related matrix-associated actin-dependent regulator 1 of chromatin subfamily A